MYNFNFWGKVYNQYEMCAHISDSQKIFDCTQTVTFEIHIERKGEMFYVLALS